MKIFLLTILLAALTGGLATAANYNQPYKYHACANNNSKECRDAREAFARHHNGQYPERWYQEWYQGQQGRWNQRSDKWQWEGAEGDQWFQGRQGHWYQERDGWQFRGDRGDEYRKGRNGWQWSGARQKHDRDRE
jgi:hypothetical protein